MEMDGNGNPLGNKLDSGHRSVQEGSNLIISTCPAFLFWPCKLSVSKAIINRPFFEDLHPVKLGMDGSLLLYEHVDLIVTLW